MIDKLSILQDQRKEKLKEYNKTPITSWKKKLHRLELGIIDGKIKIEKLKKQYQ